MLEVMRNAKPQAGAVRLFLSGTKRRRVGSSGSGVMVQMVRAVATKAIEPAARCRAAPSFLRKWVMARMAKPRWRASCASGSRTVRTTV